MIACLCGGIIEIGVFVAAMMGSGFIAWITQKIHHKKCCGHECREKEQ